MSDLVLAKVQEGGLIAPPTECYHYISEGKYLCGAPVPETAIRADNADWLKISTDDSTERTFCMGCLIHWRDDVPFNGQLMVEVE